MVTLANFLLARIAEDEDVAHQTANDPAWSTIGNRGWDDFKAHASRHDPGRVLAECAAKRTVVEVARRQVDSISEGRPHRSFLSGRVHDGCAILSALALPYADHPDYRAEWRP